MRGDVYELKAPRDAKGHEQAGRRYAVVVQRDSIPLSTLLVCPTSTSAMATDFRPEVKINGQPTRVLTEQTGAVDPQRLGQHVGHLSHEDMAAVDRALRVVLGLDR